MNTALPGADRGRLGFAALVGAYALLVMACAATLAAAGELSLGRQPWDNLLRSLAEFSRPSFLDTWFGPERLEYRSDDGTLLRVENRREVEAAWLAGLGRATWVTFQIATLGTLGAALLALPLAVLAARNLNAPWPLAVAARRASWPSRCTRPARWASCSPRASNRSTAAPCRPCAPPGPRRCRCSSRPCGRRCCRRP